MSCRCESKPFRGQRRDQARNGARLLARLVAAACLAPLCLGFFAGVCLAWNQDVLVSATSDSLDEVALVADPASPQRIYSLLARTHTSGESVPDEIAVSNDGGLSWSTLCNPVAPPQGRGGVDMAIADSVLCVASTDSDGSSASLVASLYHAEGGALLHTAVVRDGLAWGADVTLTTDAPPGAACAILCLAAVVGTDQGAELFFARSLDGGWTWCDDVVLSTGELGRVELASMGDPDGHIYAGCIQEERASVHINSSSGHSEYWGDTWGDLEVASEGARPAIAARDGVVVMAWEITFGDVDYYYSLDGGTIWHPGGTLAGTAHIEAAPALTAQPDGVFHLIYTDATEGCLYHRWSSTPAQSSSWTAPVAVSDSGVRVTPEAAQITAFEGGAVGALFIGPVHRRAHFDVDYGEASSVDDPTDRNDRDGASRDLPRARFTLDLPGMSPAQPPVEIVVRCVAAGEALTGDRVSIEILDVTGRLVRSLPLTGTLPPAGAESLTACWDGRDHRGHRVSPGSYLIRLRTTDPRGGSATQASRRILLMR